MKIKSGIDRSTIDEVLTLNRLYVVRIDCKRSAELKLDTLRVETTGPVTNQRPVTSARWDYFKLTKFF